MEVFSFNIKVSKILAAVLCFILLSCSSGPKITITNLYIKNSSWNKNNNPNIMISKISVTIPDSDTGSLSAFDIHHNTTTDSTFIYRAGNNTFGKKVIFFDGENEGFIWRNINNINQEITSIGKLDKKTWYKINFLYKSRVYYIYIDEKEEATVWWLNPVNI